MLHAKHFFDMLEPEKKLYAARSWKLAVFGHSLVEGILVPACSWAGAVSYRILAIPVFALACLWNLFTSACTESVYYLALIGYVSCFYRTTLMLEKTVYGTSF